MVACRVVACRYVKEQKRALSSLAHACVSIDQYRPEACCVIGNYYSLKGAHEKAGTSYKLQATSYKLLLPDS